MKLPLVDLSREYDLIKDEVNPVISEVIESSSFIKGPYLKKFEGEFSHFSGIKNTVCVKSGTSALTLSLKALGVSGEVITVPNTFIATTEAITNSQNKIKFVDVDEKTMLMDLDLLNEAITEKTKAVIPVNLYGQLVDVKAVSEIIGERDIKIIEDSCQAHGALFDGLAAATFSDAACYSFYPGKNLGAYGDGGAVVSNNTELTDMIFKLRDHGRSSKDKYEHTMEGFNERLDALQAAILSVKLKHLLKWVEKRRLVADKFNIKLKSVIKPYVQKGAEHAYHLYVVQSNERDELLKKLLDNGIMAGVHYPIPLHLQPAYKHLGHQKGDYPISEKLSETVLSLPNHPFLKDEEIDFISECVNSV